MRALLWVGAVALTAVALLCAVVAVPSRWLALACVRRAERALDLLADGRRP